MEFFRRPDNEPFDSDESRSDSGEEAALSYQPQQRRHRHKSDPERRGSTGFLLPSIDQTIATKEAPRLEEVNGLVVSEPSDEDDDDESSRGSRHTTSRPVALRAEEEDEPNHSEMFSGTPPRSLSAAEEEDRLRLQVLLSRLEDRAVVQRIVDVLEPLGAFVMDRKQKLFMFNLYMLEDATIALIKKLCDFDGYVFDEAGGWTDSIRLFPLPGLILRRNWLSLRASMVKIEYFFPRFSLQWSTVLSRGFRSL